MQRNVVRRRTNAAVRLAEACGAAEDRRSLFAQPLRDAVGKRRCEFGNDLGTLFD